MTHFNKGNKHAVKEHKATNNLVARVKTEDKRLWLAAAESSGYKRLTPWIIELLNQAAVEELKKNKNWADGLSDRVIDYIVEQKIVTKEIAYKAITDRSLNTEQMTKLGNSGLIELCLWCGLPNPIFNNDGGYSIID